VPRELVVGIVLGLGLSLMLDGIRMMAAGWVLAVCVLAATLALIERRRFPAMFLVLLAGACFAAWNGPRPARPARRDRVAAAPADDRPRCYRLERALGGRSALGTPAGPAHARQRADRTVEQSNRLFPNRPVTERKVALSTGLMNLRSAMVGGVPLCHGAGGMAGHVQFGARSGTAPTVIGILLVVGGILFADSVALFFAAFPAPVLGVILFLAGAQLALGICALGDGKAERFLAIATAAFAIWRVGAAFVFGLAVHHALKRGLVRL
jgi:Molybdate transporter of MFS superfamily